MNCLDFWQVILAGTFRALEKVDLFGKFNFVSYFVIILPLTYVLVFRVGSHIDETGKTIIGYGEMGVWYSFIVGFVFQLFMEIYFLCFSINWRDVSDEIYMSMGNTDAAEEEYKIKDQDRYTGSSDLTSKFSFAIKL